MAEELATNLKRLNKAIEEYRKACKEISELADKINKQCIVKSSRTIVISMRG